MLDAPLRPDQDETSIAAPQLADTDGAEPTPTQAWKRPRTSEGALPGACQVCWDLDRVEMQPCPGCFFRTCGACRARCGKKCPNCRVTKADLERNETQLMSQCALTARSRRLGSAASSTNASEPIAPDAPFVRPSHRAARHSRSRSRRRSRESSISDTNFGFTLAPTDGSASGRRPIPDPLVPAMELVRGMRLHRTGALQLSEEEFCQSALLKHPRFRRVVTTVELRYFVRRSLASRGINDQAACIAAAAATLVSLEILSKVETGAQPRAGRRVQRFVKRTSRMPPRCGT